MSVSLWVGDTSYLLGSADFVQAFFFTVAIRAESGRWAHRFPALMEDLYGGSLPAKRVRQARDELEVVEQDLRGYLPTDVVWDIKNLAAQPPWGGEVAASITSLADYFWTADGKPLIEVLNVALRSAEERGLGIIIS